MEVSRVDQILQEGSCTRQSVDNAIVELNGVLHFISAMNRVNDLPADARRLLFDIQGGVYRAHKEAKDAQIYLTYGKKEK